MVDENSFIFFNIKFTRSKTKFLMQKQLIIDMR